MLSNVEKAFVLHIHARVLYLKSPTIFSGLCCTPFLCLTTMLVAGLSAFLQHNGFGLFLVCCQEIQNTEGKTGYWNDFGRTGL